MKNSLMSWIVLLILVGYMVYSVVHTYQVYTKHKNALTAWLKENPNAELFDLSKVWIITSVIMAIIGVVIALNVQMFSNVPKDSIGLYRVAYLMIAVIFVGVIFSSKAAKRIWFSPEGFFYGDRYFRFKDIDKREPVGGVASRNLNLVFKNKYAIQINKKMDEKITQKAKLWKANRKASLRMK